MPKKNYHFDVACESCGFTVEVPPHASPAQIVGQKCPQCGKEFGANQRLLTVLKEVQPQSMTEATMGLRRVKSTIQKLREMIGEEMPKPASSSPPPPTISDPAFRARLMSVMTDNKYDRKLPKRRKGKLDSTNLWRAKAGAENVFRQKQERKNKDYHVVLLIDRSSSMNDDGKELIAAETLLFIGHELEKAGIKVSIVGFSNCSKVIKKAEVPIKKITSHDLYNDNGGTHIHDGLRRAYDEFKNDNHGKIVLAFTDGEPSIENITREGIERYQKKFGTQVLSEREVEINMPEEIEIDQPHKIAAFIEAHHDVTTIGVGILDEHVKASFKNNIIINDLNEFKTKVIAALKQSIKRG